MVAKYKVIWSATAENDLEYIVNYIGRDSVTNALNILLAIKEKCSDHSDFPERGRAVSALKVFSILQYHEIIISHWRVIYKITDKQVFVLSVIDSRRNVEDILLNRFMYSNKKD